jgi:hypothetical protein
MRMGWGLFGAKYAHYEAIMLGAFFLGHAVFNFAPRHFKARGVPTSRQRVNSAVLGISLIAIGALLWYARN